MSNDYKLHNLDIFNYLLLKYQKVKNMVEGHYIPEGSENEIKEINDLFNIFDVDQDERINPPELKRAMLSLGF